MEKDHFFSEAYRTASQAERKEIDLRAAQVVFDKYSKILKSKQTLPPDVHIVRSFGPDWERNLIVDSRTLGITSAEIQGQSDENYDERCALSEGGELPSPSGELDEDVIVRIMENRLASERLAEIQRITTEKNK